MSRGVIHVFGRSAVSGKISTLNMLILPYITCEPGQNVGVFEAVTQAGVEFLADVAGESGDFSGSGDHRLFGFRVCALCALVTLYRWTSPVQRWTKAVQRSQKWIRGFVDHGRN